MAVLSRRPLQLAAALLLLAASWAGDAGAQVVASESDVKAAFLYNFTKFVEWPPAAFPDAGSSLRLCVLGEERVGRSLRSVIRNEEVGGRKLTLQELAANRDSVGCHVLFIGRSESERTSRILSELGGSNALVVGETDGFLAQGGAINFLLERGKVRFEINPKAAEERGLKISSKLLRLARIAP